MRLKNEITSVGNIDSVARFYGSGLGWRMFDGKFLTPELSAFLRAEAILLSSVVQEFERFNHLIEVGCGFGRYLSWAIDQGHGYDGVELISWLAQMGQERIKQKTQSTMLTKPVAITHGSASVIDFLLRETFLNREINPIVFFPFNCFGNLSNPRLALRSLCENADTIIISTFATNAYATVTRSKYYENCGYQNLKSEQNECGVLVSSEDGLHSYAYSLEFLEKIMNEFGYDLDRRMEFGGIGMFYIFRREVQEKLRYAVQQIALKASEIKEKIKQEIRVRLALLLEPMAGSCAYDISIQQFRDDDGRLVSFSDNRIQVQSAQIFWPLGTLVKIDIEALQEVFIGQVVHLENDIDRTVLVTLEMKDLRAVELLNQIFTTGVS